MGNEFGRVLFSRRVRIAVLSAVLFAPKAVLVGQDSGWPRVTTTNGVKLVSYQPQVDAWRNYTEIEWREAFEVTPPGGKPVIGVAAMSGTTDVVADRDLVIIGNLNFKSLRFPSLDDAESARMDALVRSLVPATVAVSLTRVVACVPKPATAPAVPLRNDPPPIFVSTRPAILLFVDGQPQLAPVPNTTLEFVVNTSWPLFLDKPNAMFYLLAGQEWMSAQDLKGPWTHTRQLPADMSKVAQDPEWASLKPVVPPPAVQPVMPTIYYSMSPAEVVLFDGEPKFSPVPATQLTYATNTESDLFVHTPTKQYYLLTSGRWFRAASFSGPWVFATPSLPADFAKIPAQHPAGHVRVSVPGTDEAKDAVLLAQVPTTLVIDPVAAAKEAKVTYNGTPQFSPITGTTMSYAVNTSDKVIKVGDVYYLCLQGVWFLSPNPQGPWTTAESVPQQIYTIPPSSPVYNVTYVTQTTTSSGSVSASHTAGYVGAFVVGMTVGAVVANGSGYYYPPYIYRPPYGYPIYRPYPVTYGYPVHYTAAYGAYGAARTVYSPYGAATRAAAYNPYTGTYARGAAVATPYGTRAAAQAYNPYTGTAARAASVSTPYGSRSAAQSYNPYTGTYKATAQGSAPGAQWGTSVVQRGGQTAVTQHYSTYQGTVASAQTSAGGQAVAASGARGNAMVGQTASGDLYAGKDGNAYKNTGSGWQKYENGSWSSVAPNASSAQANAASNQAARQSTMQQSAATAQANAASRQSTWQQNAGSAYSSRDLNQEWQNRQRGSMSSERVQSGGTRSYSGGARRR